MSSEIHRIKVAIEENFKSVYTDCTHIGTGSTAYVFSMKHIALDVLRVIKVFKQEYAANEENLQDIRDEAKATAQLTHENVISIFEAGEISIQNTKPIAPEVDASALSVSIPYYIMEYLDGASTLREFINREASVLTDDFILSVFSQTLNGLSFIHRNKRIHHDIKEDNLLVNKDGKVKIFDFGFSKPNDDNQEEDKYVIIRGTSDYWPELIKQENCVQDIGSNANRAFGLIRQEYNSALLDVHALSLVFSRVIKNPNIKKLFSATDFSYILEIASKMNLDDTSSENYSSTDEIINDFAKLNKSFIPVAGIPEFSFIPKIGVIRIPDAMGVPFTSRVKLIVDHPWFQRLRNAKQMGFAYLVYPGAMHTRFEHSLGVYYNSIKYITALLGDERTPFFKINASPENMLSVLAAALLHDIGQHTFGHSLEEDLLFHHHETYTSRFINGRDDGLLGMLPKSKRTIEDILINDWGLGATDLLNYIISGEDPNGKMNSPINNILKSIVNGPLDADKIDYLRRDSIHAGTPYGLSLDEGRFLQSLTACKEHECIAFNQKGKVCAELFFISRSHMHAEVYWHHAVRSFSGMLNNAIQLFVQKHPSNSTKYNLLKQNIYCSPEHTVLRFLYENGGREAKEIVDCVIKRLPYKRLLIIEEFSLYQDLTRIKKETAHDDYWKFIKEIKDEIIKEHFDRKKVKPSHFFLDIPVANKHMLGELFIYNQETEKLEDFRTKSNFWSGQQQEWERSIRKIRLYCHPKLFENMVGRESDIRKSIMGIIKKNVNNLMKR